ncbi:isoniazid response ATPase/transcriptional regulator IniR [Mycolicibacterium sp. 050158]|uniref:isoniazid response ATPase/transcriptional regulator IniR n=1 Tax=Mycolicibacterium sp. 050158 TaxID=3090602 RepID=UPI00299EBD6A|nr:isoniazid response ATPase/transcriptional regulator IniR [Mycolicibacterium sp. 050158]MDX1892743.1 isoniazid response ATPase/transcriptional regulator IniR [Mycolicibacterium sp. 050158]
MIASDAVAAMASAPSEPATMLVSGGVGTGKTSLLAQIRSTLRAAGMTVLARPPRDGDPQASAIVVDDAQLLTDEELRELAGLVGDPARTIVIATEPLSHRPALASLRTALSREAPVISLDPLSTEDVHRRALDVLGVAPTTEYVEATMHATAGLPFLVDAAIAAAADRAGASPTEAIATAARVALIERLRRVDERVLDTLLLSSLSGDIGPDDVAAALDTDQEQARRLVDVARASGLIAPSHDAAFTRSLHGALAQIVGAAHHRDVEAALLHTQLEKSTLSMDLALILAEHGLRDARLANSLTEFAVRHRDDAAIAARLYRAATRVGASEVSAALADALALTGDCATAGRLADELLGSEVAAERAAAVRIAASIAMHDGRATQAVELVRWLGPYADAVVGATAVVAALGVGDLATARAASEIDSSGPPTSTARAARGLTEGLLATLSGPYPNAVARLAQSMTEQPAAVVTPDAPAALVTLVALHAGDSVRARGAIGRAVRGTGDDRGFTGYRHTLLLGWARMLDGQLTAAGADAASVAGRDLHRRDALWAAALQTAVARRGGDSGAVQKHWHAAMEVLADYSMDLYALLPLGELWVAAARLRQVDLIQPAVDQAFELLGLLDDPPLWSVPLHWSGVHAGILANSPGSVAPHGQALTAAAVHSPFARALSTAGRSWLRVLANHVDVDEVTAAARALAQFGLTWDATRLASQAALQTPDGRVSGAMLQLARDLKFTATGGEEDVAPPVTPATAPVPPRGPAATPTARLSDREREVAELLLQGMPYRDIGSQLFISAKTVEHHVARIRRRLGAESRSELMSMLRAILESPRT